MGRPRKQVISDETYEVSMRTGYGLPFVTTLYMQLILQGIVARVQRDMKVVINHLIWMANHAHIIIQAKDADQCKSFYGEVQKQLTEAVKRLLGRKHLCLWRSNETSLVRLGDKAAVMKRIAYLYANPARANLVDSIDKYPGVSSWSGFINSASSVNTLISKNHPWIQAPMIPRLPVLAVSGAQDLRIAEGMLSRAVRSHELILQPNAWMKRYGISSPEDVAATNRSILAMVREHEEKARDKRNAAGLKVKGANRLRREALTLNYRPKKETRRIFVYAADKDIRIKMIAHYRGFCARCRECYQRWKRGELSVEWPPGAYKPPQPSTTNWLLTSLG